MEAPAEGGSCGCTDSCRAAGIEQSREAGASGQLADVTSRFDPL